MKKLLILVMLLSMGLAGVISAGRGNFNYYRWDTGNGTAVQQYQRDFSTTPTSKLTVSTDGIRFPNQNNLPTNGLETPTLGKRFQLCRPF